MADQQLTGDEIEFTNAFNNQRKLLAGFATCKDAEELSVVRDGLYLGLGHDLCPNEYDPVQCDIVTSLSVAESTRQANGFANTITAARASTGWEALVQAVLNKAQAVGSDLPGIWKTLETGRLEWLQAASGAHKLKMTLRNGLNQQCGGGPSEGDVSDAKMIWMYSLCLNIPSLKPHAMTWAQHAKLSDPERPLVGYQADLWDPRHELWEALDLGAQAAAERGGSSIDEAWKAE